MYCKNCGAQIEKGVLCPDCLALLEEARKENDRQITQKTIMETAVVESPLETETVTPVLEKKTPVVVEESAVTEAPAVAPPYQPLYTQATQPETPTIISAKKGIWGVILSSIGVMFQFIVYFMMIENIAYAAAYQPTAMASVVLPQLIACLFLSIPTVLGLLFGILSFVSFFKNKKNGKKTWANLILGAIALETSIVGVVFLFITFLIAFIAIITGAAVII